MSSRAEVRPQYYQHRFSPDNGEFRQMPEPLPVNPDGSFMDRREWIKEQAQKIPTISEDLPDPVLSENGLVVLEKRYLSRDEKENLIETPKEMFWRVAYNVAMADKLYNGQEVERTAREFYEVMANLEFLPNSPTLMNAGRRLQQLSACFVLPVEDSLDSIMDAAKATALIHQSGGGTGFSFSRLRPEGSPVKSSGGQASGPLSFMKIFDQTTEQIKQGGRRRGANMGILRVDHPDIEKFVNAKTKPGVFENFNLSVAVTDEFMEAVKGDGEYDLVNPHTGEKTKTKAGEIFNLIVECAWRSGEPGVVFIDEINRKNPTSHLGPIESTNPCGEQPLHPYESCNLGSINLSKMIKEGRVDWEKLEKTIKVAVHFLDNVIDVNRYPLPEIEKMTLGNRKIGLGIMGFADMLVQLGISYDSQPGLETSEAVMKFIQEKGYEASEVLAKIRGVFPNWEESLHQKEGRKLRNATITTIAPTGTIGIIAGCSQGCEPYYALSFERKGILDGKTTIFELNPYVEEITKEECLEEAVIERIKKEGSLRQIPEVPDRMKKIFPTALEISPEWHVRIQAAFQRHIDNAVSKTINFPQEATADDIRQAYLLAYNVGCKGLTIYRDKSRERQVLYAGEKREEVGERRPRSRPEVTRGETEKISLGCGQTLYVTINEDKEGLCEVFCQMGKSGGCITSHSEVVGRLISLNLRSGVIPEAIIKQLRGIRCPSPTWNSGRSILSCADAIGQVIERYKKGREGASQESFLSIKMSPEIKNEGQHDSSENALGYCPECPECGAMFQFSEGCVRCPACGYSQCG